MTTTVWLVSAPLNDQDFDSPGKNSASFERDGITPGSIVTFLSPRWFFSAIDTVSALRTRPCSPWPSLSHMRMNRM